MTRTDRQRTGQRRRATKETSIEVDIDLDGTGTTDISTGIPFYDHMLDQIGRHGGFDLRIHGDRRPAHRHPPHRRGRGDRARRGVRRGARRQGGRAPVRQRALSARRGTGRRGARPVRSTVGRVACADARVVATRRPRVRSAARRTCRRLVRDRSEHHVARRTRPRAQRAPHHRSNVQGAGDERCATPFASTTPVACRRPKVCCEGRAVRGVS